MLSPSSKTAGNPPTAGSKRPAFPAFYGSIFPAATRRTTFWWTVLAFWPLFPADSSSGPGCRCVSRPGHRWMKDPGGFSWDCASIWWLAFWCSGSVNRGEIQRNLRSNLLDPGRLFPFPILGGINEDSGKIQEFLLISMKQSRSLLFPAEKKNKIPGGIYYCCFYTHEFPWESMDSII